MISNIEQAKSGTASESREPVYYPLDESAARTAHEMKSFRGYRSDVPDYRSEVDKAYELAGKVAAEKPEHAEEAYRLAKGFSRKYAKWLNRGYRIEAMCPSILVAGPAGVSPSRKERQSRALDSHMAERADVMSIIDRIGRLATTPDVIKCGDAEAVAKLAEKVERLKARQETMKLENARARKEGREAPHPGWELSNNRQNLRAAEKRLEAIARQKETGSSERTATILGEEARVIENASEMRLQLVFEDKPSEEVRSLLKRSGFRWSRKTGAWQRQLTHNARCALGMMEDADHQ
ncbi:hypothetical protein [Adlercreutzia sp. ZJ141]|uniref:hypothetical protein n=1 Tax=Adlercreutzia sp. ZJ141 TaxID=2709406 RepID=UPI0013EC7428|nr:hypothetical protein [Adlercreutzia sp. ZJ141]